MKTSVDQEIVEARKRRRNEACKTGSIIIGLVLLCLVTAGAIGCAREINESPAAQPSGVQPPVAQPTETQPPAATDLPPCSCQGWNPLTVNWEGSAPGTYPDVACGSMVTIDKVTTGTNVLVGVNPCKIFTINTCKGGQTFDYTVTPPAGSPVEQRESAPAVFVPASTGTYKVVLNATCGGESCTPCTINILIKNLVELPCACRDWSLGGFISWGGSSPGTGYGLCGGSPVVIPSLTSGEPIKITDALVKCRDVCGPITYNWTITPPIGSPIQSGSISTGSFSFTPNSAGSYTILVNASCGTATCPPCTYTIVVSNLASSSQ
jgi:hypothetical protein